MNSQMIAILFALIAAILYAINIPVAKILLQNVNAIYMASFLYFGAGIGMSVYSLLFNKNKKSKLTKKELPFTLAMVILDIIAPILLMIGLGLASSSNAALLNNFEIVATSLIALVIFKEIISPKMWLAIFLITISSILLSLENSESLRFSWGSLLILLACISWGFENNCTRVLSSKSTYQIVIIKGIFSGIGSLIIALVLKIQFPPLIYLFFTMALGFVSYGLSIFFYVKSQSIIGAAKTSAFYAVSPFIGALLSFIMLKETLSDNYLIALIIMVAGSVLIVTDTLVIKHNHFHTHFLDNVGTNSKKEQTIVHSHSHLHLINKENKHKHNHYKMNT